MTDRRHFLKSGLAISLTTLIGSPILASELTNSVTTHSATKIFPKALKKGTKVAISSPAGTVWDSKQVETFTHILTGFGFEVVLGKTLSLKHGYFAGTDEERANELNQFFADKTISAIFCMKGGWGCARILDLLNYSLIKQNPKILIGFSDITALLLAITNQTGLITFHGPVGNSGWNEFTTEVFKKVCMNAEAVQYPKNPVTDLQLKVHSKGIATGELWGGNLTVLTSLIGSKYLPDFKGAILFLEEAKEEPYSIDRMLTQLKLSGIIDNVSGIIFGKCCKCLAEEPAKAFTIEEVLSQHFSDLKIPVVSDFMIGHIENKLTLPLGALATLNTEKGSLELVKSATI